jgi:BREX protein BrxB
VTRLDLLRKNYVRICGMPWDTNVAGPQRVWIAVYDKEDERKLRLRLRLFEEATHQAGRRWHAVDLTDAFADWICGPETAAYAESYFESPDLMDDAVLADFKQAAVMRVDSALAQLQDAENTVLAIHGVGGLFGFLRVSELLPQVDGRVRGRLLVFFPGTYERDNYRLFDARDGWNYHASPIIAGDVELRP